MGVSTIVTKYNDSLFILQVSTYIVYEYLIIDSCHKSGLYWKALFPDHDWWFLGSVIPRPPPSHEEKQSGGKSYLKYSNEDEQILLL